MTDMDRAGAVDEFLLDVEHFAKWMSQPLTPAMTYINERGKELALKAAALRAALSREPREEGPIVPISERPASDTNKVVEAIAFYADPKHYEVDPVSMLSCVERDGGAKAREATSALLYAHPPAPAGEKDRCPTCGQTPMRVRRFTREVPVIVDDDEPTPAERAAAGLHDAGGVGEAKAAFYERALKFVAAYKAYADAIGNGLPRKGTDVVWADKEQHAKCIDLLIAYDALLAAEARRGESGEAIAAQGGTP